MEERSAALSLLAQEFGTLVKGRNGQLVEILEPKSIKEAQRNSLSEQYGKGRFPFHIDMAHRQVPARILLFACVGGGPKATPTFLVDARQLLFNEHEREVLKTGVFLIRNSRSSFYANIDQSDGSFLRWDPGCMYAQDQRARDATKAMFFRVEHAVRHTIKWSDGAVLVVDNWRMLHARGCVADDNDKRVLLRVSVK